MDEDITGSNPDEPISVEVEVPPAPEDSSDRFAWERRRYGLIARAMETQRLPPALAAEMVDALLPELPFEIHKRAASTLERPGGLRPTHRDTWLVMCRAETEDEPLVVPSDERLTGEMLRAAAEAYDPEFRTAKVILGHGGPAHVMGRFEPPVAMIRAVEFDGHFLWGLARDNGMRSLEWTVASGAHDRSIFVRPASELEGAPPYVDHVALLWAEWPIQPNLGSLESLFKTSGGEQELARSEGWRYQALTKPAPKEEPMRKTRTEDPIAELPEDQRGLARTILDAVKGLLTASPPDDGGEAASDPEPAAKPAARTEDAGGDQGALARAVETLTEQVTALGAKIKAGEEAGAAAAYRARCERVDTVLNGLVRAMRIAPAEAEVWRKELKAEDMTAERAEAMLGALASRPASSELARTVILPGGENDAGAEVPIVRSPSGLSGDPERTQLYARAERVARERTAGKGEEAFRAELYRIVTTESPASLAN